MGKGAEMSKVLAIPDIHLKPLIFDKADKILESGQADFAVQLGDMVDDWGEEFNFALYERTLKRAIEFHKKFPKTLWCMGNHDYGYHHPNMGVRESGHSRIAEDIVKPLLKEMGKVGAKQQIIHVVDNVIFSHAGILDDWVNMLTLDDIRELDDYVESLIQNAGCEELWDEKSPIWARPQRTGDIMFTDRMQVVGHTPVATISFVNNVLSTDAFSTYSNGAPIGEKRFAIVDTEKMTWKYATEEND